MFVFCYINLCYIVVRAVCIAYTWYLVWRFSINTHDVVLTEDNQAHLVVEGGGVVDCAFRTNYSKQHVRGNTLLKDSVLAYRATDY